MWLVGKVVERNGLLPEGVGKVTGKENGGKGEGNRKGEKG